MPRQEKQVINVFTSAAIKWAITIIGGLILAGAVSLANRDVYNKQQVDYKLHAEREWSDAQDRMIMRALEDRGQAIDGKLDMIREDQQQIKKMLREK